MPKLAVSLLMSSLSTFIDANMVPDYSKMQLPFTDSFKTNVGVFIANDDNVAINENANYIEEASFESITRDELLEDYAQRQKASKIEFQESTSSDYPTRTNINASADTTIAIAVDFESGGEKLTRVQFYVSVKYIYL